VKIACVGYRDWALKIYDAIINCVDYPILMIRSKNQYSDQLIHDIKPDCILFYGWSWKINPTIITNYRCIMLHPSPLPNYRGGSPIQNQIIRGEKESAVTLFLMNEGLDTGDIIAQKKISLEGHLDEIFARITQTGIELTLQILKTTALPTIKQTEANATFYKRLTPADSEITLKELESVSGEYLYNKIRMLEDPYPNAFIKTADGRKLLIKRAELAD